jgi:uncharacterized protein (TIGR03437 family)
MLLHRVGQSLLRLLRTPHRGYALGMLLSAALLLGAGKMSAQWYAASAVTKAPLPLKLMPARSISSSSAAPCVNGSAPVTTVSAASFEAPIAPESIVSAFGVNLATETVSSTDTDPAPGIQLPTQLAGTTVEVNGRRAGLFFVSCFQVNFHVPAETAAGPANVVIRSGDNIVSSGTVQITRVAPSVFTANANGSGVPAASLLRFRANGQQAYEPISQFSAEAGRFIPKAIDLGTQSDRVYLVLSMTGVRGADNTVENGPNNVSESFRVLVGGVELTPDYVGPQPLFVGLDQLNVVIPKSLSGSGTIDVTVNAVGFSSSRTVSIEIGGAGGAGPQVMGFGSSALAGQELVINGSGFSTEVNLNTVKINGLAMQVMEAKSNQLKVMVPYGVETGTVSVTTGQGTGISPMVLPVRTSISGFVEDQGTSKPLSGILVRAQPPSGPEITVMTNADGVFVLPDTGPGPINIDVDGGSLGTQPPYPVFSAKHLVYGNRDNPFPRAIPLQQATGHGGTVGSGSFTGDGAQGLAQNAAATPPQPLPLTLSTGGYQLDVPANVRASFPDGATSGRIILTPLSNARTPVTLPPGVYSASIAQITPFKVTFDPGLKISFPNSERFPANAPVDLYRYDFDASRFVKEKDPAYVSADGQRIETVPDAVKITSYYFAAQQRQTTDIRGFVKDKNNKPVSRATVDFRGQNAVTDGNGSFLMRFVPVSITDTVVVNVTAARGAGRVDRLQSDPPVAAVVGGITRVPDIILPDEKDNRPPTILAPPEVDVLAGTTLDLPIVVSDPDPGQTLTLTAEGRASVFTTVPPNPTGVALYSIRIAPTSAQAGDYTLILTASDGMASTKHEITIKVIKPNRPPSAFSQTVSVDEDSTVNITLSGADPDRAPLTYTVVAQPRNGSLSGVAPNLIYKPNLNFNGNDRLSFIVSNGTEESNVAVVTILVRSINDAPILTVPGAQTIREGQTLNFAVSAADPDTGQRLTFTATGLPENAQFTVASATSRQFTWTPDLTQAGSYTFTFRVTDDGNPALSDEKIVRVTVTDLALITVPGAQIVSEGQPLNFSVASTQGPGLVNIRATGLPTGAQFATTSPTAGQFSWTPTTSQSGTYLLTFLATLNNTTPPVSETRQVTVIVLDVIRELAKESAPFNVFGARGTVQQPSGPDEGDALGAQVATGDLNGDGVADLIIGAPTANGGGGINTGKVYVFFGKAELSGSPDLSRERADVEISGTDSYDLFGTSLVVADINGDGKNDLVSGAPFADGDDRPDAGKVYVISGPLAHGAYPLDRLSPLTITGAARSDQLGTSLAAARMRAKDGPADLIIGAPGYDVPGTTSSLANGGAVFVVFGSTRLEPAIDLASRAADYVLTGAAANAQIGTALATGNFNGDDFADLAIGAPLANSNNLRGLTYLVLGAANKAGTKNIAQEANFSTGGSETTSGFGRAVALGDLDGDGLAELIIGAPGDSFNNTRSAAGSVTIIRGTSATINGVATTVVGVGVTGDPFGDALGTSLATGDFNGDGIADLAIGAPGADAVDSQREPAGTIYLIYGARTGLPVLFDLARRAADYTVYGADVGDKLGSGGLAVNDVNATTPHDLIFGTPNARSVNNARPNAGEARVLFGFRR